MPPELAGELLQCGVGACFTVTPACALGAPGQCESSPPGLEEICANGIDDNCNGEIDELCSCNAGDTQRCFPGSPAARNQGACADGQQTCDNGVWSVECEGAVLPQADICDGLDNTCDGHVDEGCACDPGEEQTCYVGPLGTRGVGRCRDGKQTCDADGTWTDCLGDVGPTLEVCNSFDDDCDGETDPQPLCD